MNRILWFEITELSAYVSGVIASFFGACILYDKVFGYLYFFVEQIIENRLGSIYKKPLLETTLDTN